MHASPTQERARGHLEKSLGPSLCSCYMLIG